MSMKSACLWSVSAVLAAFASGAVETAAPVQDQLAESSLLGCDVNIRPKDRIPTDDKRADVYWTETSPGVVQFTIRVTANGYFTLGDYVAATASVIPLTQGTDTVVTLTFDNSSPAMPVVYLTANNGAGGVVPSRVNGRTGSYDALGPLREPYGVEVAAESANQSRLRVLIEYRGITSGFTITR